MSEPTTPRVPSDPLDGNGAADRAVQPAKARAAGPSGSRGSGRPSTDAHEILISAIDYQLRAFEAVERIRWSGIALLGGVGLLSLFAQGRGIGSEEFPQAARIAAGALAMAVAVAGMLIQVRISAIAVSTIGRMRTLQRELASLLQEDVGPGTREAMLLPSARTHGDGSVLLKSPPVSVAYFLFFGTSGGVGLALAVYDPARPDALLPLFLGLGFCSLLIVVGLLWSRWSRAAVEHERGMARH